MRTLGLEIKPHAKLPKPLGFVGLHWQIRVIARALKGCWVAWLAASRGCGGRHSRESTHGFPNAGQQRLSRLLAGSVTESYLAVLA